VYSPGEITPAKFTFAFEPDLDLKPANILVTAAGIKLLDSMGSASVTTSVNVPP
jgi:hypothetical protein